MKFKDRAALAWKILKARDLGETHATRELAIALPGTDEMDVWFRKAVEEVIFVFGLAGHSGFSAAYAIGAIEKLLKHEPLTALTGAEDEWCDMSEYSQEPHWQNRRDSRVFKGADGQAYIIDHFVFVDPDGSTYTRGDRHPIQFPYEGEDPELIHVDAHGMPLDPKYYALCGVVPPIPKVVEKFPVKAKMLAGALRITAGDHTAHVKFPPMKKDLEAAFDTLLDLSTDNLRQRMIVAAHEALSEKPK